MQSKDAWADVAGGPRILSHEEAMLNERNPYLRYYGDGVYWIDTPALVADALPPRFRPSFRARLAGAGSPIIRLPALDPPDTDHAS